MATKQEDTGAEIPVLIVTSDRWARTAYAVFGDEQITDIIPGDWVKEEWLRQRDEADDLGEEFTKTENDVLLELEDEFYAENDAVLEWYPRRRIAAVDDRDGRAFYRVDPDGQVEYIVSGTLRDLSESLRI